MKKFLVNSQMGRVVANFLKKDPAVDDHGKIALSAEEEQQLTQHFGAKFVEILKDKTFTTVDDNATDLYEAAVAHAREEVENRFADTINQLQSEVATLAAQPEVLPAAEKALGVVGARQKSTFKADMSLTHNRATSAFLQTGVMMPPQQSMSVISKKKPARICRKATTSTSSNSSTRAFPSRNFSIGFRPLPNTKPYSLCRLAGSCSNSKRSGHPRAAPSSNR